MLTVILFGSAFYIYRTRELGPVGVTPEIEVIRQLQDAELHYQKAIQALDEASRHRIQSAEPRMAQILNDNLATIDYYVNECQEAAHHTPGNPLIQKNLMAAYQKKAELLQSIVNSDVL
jgi:vacuolar-type H+-ATPase subunit H